jgi:hypothetical protein
MMPAKARLLLAGVLCVSACRNQGATSSSSGAGTSSVAAPPSSAPAPVKTITSAAPLRAGSLLAGTPEERERALLQFVESGQAAQVEVVATEPGAQLDRSLRRTLLGHVVGPNAPATPTSR